MPIVVSIDGKIAQISIERMEKRNTLDIKMCQELSKHLLELDVDSRVRSILICGQSNIFCAGLDIEEQSSKLEELNAAFQTVIDALDSSSKPIVAAVNGPAVNQGVALLYHCDMVFCGAHSMFSLPALALGLTPQYGVSLLAVRSAGYKLATQKILLSEPISAPEAIAMGIVNHMVDDDKVMTTASAAALRLSSMPPRALEATKRLLKAAYMQGMSEQRSLEVEAFSTVAGAAENKEAFQAFMEKRPPKFDD